MVNFRLAAFFPAKVHIMIDALLSESDEDALAMAAHVVDGDLHEARDLPPVAAVLPDHL